MKSAVAHIRMLWHRFKGSAWYRLSELGVLTISFGLMIYACISNFSRVNFSALQFDPGPFLIAVILTWIAVWLGAVAWAQILKAFQPQLPYSVAIRSHMLSLATKYVPGLGWQQVSKAIQLNQQGIPNRQTALAVMLEFVLIIFTGMLTAAQILSMTQQNVLHINLSPGARFFVPAVLWIMSILIPPLWIKFFADAEIRTLNMRAFMGHMMFAVFIQIVGWVVFGTGLWFTCLSVYPISANSLPQFIVALIGSFLIGMAVILAPNGIGVREVAMSTLLQMFIPLPVGVIVSIMSRGVLVISELIGVLPFLLMKYKHKASRT